MGQLQEKYKSYRLPQKYMAEGVYPYFREITSKQGTEVEMGRTQGPYVRLERLYRTYR